MEDFIFIKENPSAEDEKLKAIIDPAFAACLAAVEAMEHYDEIGDEAAELAAQKAEAAVANFHKLRAEIKAEANRNL
jgi:hypothetical protein